MPRIAYVDGRYVPHARAHVHVEDRGYQFADAVYEVCAVRDGHLLDEEGHLARLDRSLSELRMACPVTRPVLQHILREVARRNRLRNGIIYFQISRGVAPRDHAFPGPDTHPILVVTAKTSSPQLADAKADQGVGVITMPDERWARCDIKTVALLPNVLAKQRAREAGAYEAWLVDDQGFVTEGSSSNAWIVRPDGKLQTRPANNAILNGITRRALFRLAGERGIEIVEEPFTVEEALAAREAFISSASSFALPVVRIDDQPLGNGAPGLTTMALRDAYLQDS